jgi:hypothetical protein
MKNHLFNVIPNKLNKSQVIFQNEIQKIDFLKGEKGDKGDNGTPGDRFTTKTLCEIILQPKKNSVVIFDVEPGLAYITGNSVIVAQIPKYLDDEINSFEGTIQYYGKESGQIIINDIHCKLHFFSSTCFLVHVNWCVHSMSCNIFYTFVIG